MKIQSSFHCVLNIPADRSRRRFIRNVVLGTAVSFLQSESWLNTVLADCQPAQPGSGVMLVKIADFPALQHQNGSVRLALNPFTTAGPTGAFYPVLINRGPNDQFFTLSTDCQHLHCVVPTYSATVGASLCPCHGSKYAIDGSVLRGPTVKPLIRYSNSFDGVTLCVQIPGLGITVTGTTLQSGVGPRFQLTFPTMSTLKYQVLLRQSLLDAGAVIPFATTSDGNANTTALTGTGSQATIFVDRASGNGFYSVAVQVTQG